jgi:hypothetical protein
MPGINLKLGAQPEAEDDSVEKWRRGLQRRDALGKQVSINGGQPAINQP